MSELILVRHGQSEWNKKNIFTGWVDIPLSQEGVKEAVKAGQLLANRKIDKIYTSTLIRGLMTAMLIMSEHKGGKVPVIDHTGEGGKEEEWGKCYGEAGTAEVIPVITAWQLNERMYGELQGQNKDETRAKFGKEQVHIWRRSYDVAPPKGESLKMTAARTLPYFDKEILPLVKAGQSILISAHGNSLRSIVMELQGLSETEVVDLEIPTGAPLIYSYKEGGWEKHALL